MHGFDYVFNMLEVLFVLAVIGGVAVIGALVWLVVYCIKSIGS